MQKGILLRQINEVYKDDYNMLISSGLYEALVSKNLLVKHTDTKEKGSGWKVIKPTPVPFISYPYEWAFGMLKDAALLTLNIQKIALEHGMSLKDASAFNIQFVSGSPILIDTLSFEKYVEGKPWIAYKQFVEHFLSPLALASYLDVRLLRMTSVFLDGVPVDLAASMLPLRARIKPSLLFHIFAHASSVKKYEDKKIEKNVKARKFSKRALLGLIDNLEGAVKSLKWSPKGTQWEDYYEDNNNYKTESFKSKGDLVRKFLNEVKPKTVWDMGANTGYFSKIAVETGAQVNAFDVDYGALEKGYQEIKKDSNAKILPLFCDMTNMTPAVGWENLERESLISRGPADAVLALALIHHLAITNNMPFDLCARAFSKIGKYLVIEFVAKEDSQVQILLSTRKDIFPNYTRDNFEKVFSEYYTIIHKVSIKGSLRTLYLLKRKNG